MNDGDAGQPSARRGWSSQGLPVVAIDDDRYWSVFDMTAMFNMTEKRVRAFIELAELKYIGKRHSGARKRHIPVYLAREVLDAYKKAAPLLLSSTNGQDDIPAAELLI